MHALSWNRISAPTASTSSVVDTLAAFLFFCGVFCGVQRIMAGRMGEQRAGQDLWQNAAVEVQGDGEWYMPQMRCPCVLSHCLSLSLCLSVATVCGENPWHRDLDPRSWMLSSQSTRLGSVMCKTKQFQKLNFVNWQVSGIELNGLVWMQSAILTSCCNQGAVPCITIGWETLLHCHIMWWL